MTKDGFVQTPPSSDAAHFHGHVATEEHQINHMTIFYGSVPLQAHEVFSQNPTKHHSLVFSSAVDQIASGSALVRKLWGSSMRSFIVALLRFSLRCGKTIINCLELRFQRASSAQMSSKKCGYENEESGKTGRVSLEQERNGIAEKVEESCFEDWSQFHGSSCVLLACIGALWELEAPF